MTRRTAAILLAAALTLAAAANALAEAAAAKGLAIATEAKARDSGWGDQTATGAMILRDAQGTESRRGFRTLTLEEPSDRRGDKSVVVFEEPRDIRGTSLLTHSNIEPADDDQWLFLPALKRVKRISSSNRTGKFVSSEFAYEDLGSIEVPDFDYKYLRDEPCPGATELVCFVIESTPKNPRSGYSKQVGWVDQQHYRFFRTDYYNRRGDLEKTLTAHDYRQYLDRFWRAGLLRMVNHQTGKSTDLVWKDYRFRTGLSAADVNPQMLPQMAR